MAQTEHLTPSPEGLRWATDLLRKGALVAFPTETVYGLGGLASRDTAVARIYDAKARPRRNPLIIHVADLEAAQAIAEFDALAHDLATAYWPGPLTLVLPLKADCAVSQLATAGLTTVALRVPDQPVALDLLQRVGEPLAAPSANPSGRMSPTSATHVLANLGGRIAAVLDGGSCDVGLESTIVQTHPEPRLLRPGALTQAQIEAVLGHPLSMRDPAVINAPGQLASHYAPQNPLRMNVCAPDPGERLLGFGAVDGDMNLSPSGDLSEAARNLFHYLHQLDAKPGALAVAPIPNEGLGVAINDRLRRAAADR
ncbi:MAG: L-threonylcarbamoyladenylate synthase [Pseudomonadota bacterium]